MMVMFGVIGLTALFLLIYLTVILWRGDKQ